MAIVHKGATIVTISENAFGKQTPVEEYRLQQRGGSGVKAGIFNEKTGKLVALKQIDSDSDLLMIADSGIIIRTHVSDISQFSRVSQGVRLMKLKNNAKITSVALAEKEEDIEDESAEISTPVENEIETTAVETVETTETANEEDFE